LPDIKIIYQKKTLLYLHTKKVRESGKGVSYFIQTCRRFPA